MPYLTFFWTLVTSFRPLVTSFWPLITSFRTLILVQNLILVSGCQPNTYRYRIVYLTADYFKKTFTVDMYDM